MPQTITRTITLYKYEELSETAKEKAREWYYRASANDEWWESSYEDAANIGLEIKEFDIDRGSYIKGDFTGSAKACADAIVKDHGPEADSAKIAAFFLAEYDALNTKMATFNESDEKAQALLDQIEEIKDEFLKNILAEYLKLLKSEAEYISSEEYIAENIIANDYTFSESGERLD